MGSCCSKRRLDAPLGLQSLNLPLTVAGEGLQVLSKGFRVLATVWDCGTLLVACVRLNILFWQVGISTAGWLSKLPLDEQVAVVCTKEYTLVALFEGRGRHTGTVNSPIIAQV